MAQSSPMLPLLLLGGGGIALFLFMSSKSSSSSSTPSGGLTVGSGAPPLPGGLPANYTQLQNAALDRANKAAKAAGEAAGPAYIKLFKEQHGGMDPATFNAAMQRAGDRAAVAAGQAGRDAAGAYLEILRQQQAAEADKEAQHQAEMAHTAATGELPPFDTSEICRPECLAWIAKADAWNANPQLGPMNAMGFQALINYPKEPPNCHLIVPPDDENGIAYNKYCRDY